MPLLLKHNTPVPPLSRIVVMTPSFLPDMYGRRMPSTPLPTETLKPHDGHATKQQYLHTNNELAHSTLQQSRQGLTFQRPAPSFLNFYAILLKTTQLRPIESSDTWCTPDHSLFNAVPPLATQIFKVILMQLLLIT